MLTAQPWRLIWSTFSRLSTISSLGLFWKSDTFPSHVRHTTAPADSTKVVCMLPMLIATYCKNVLPTIAAVVPLGLLFNDCHCHISLLLVNEVSPTGLKI